MFRTLIPCFLPLCSETITIARSAEIGTPLFVVMATDNDLANTPNSAVTFKLSNTSVFFAIDATLGNISVSDAVFLPGTYDFDVEASDMGTPQLTSVGTFSIIVAPPNSHDPEFPVPFTASFDENDVPDIPVFEFDVTDNDSPEAEGQVTITLLPSEFSTSFTLNQTGNRGQLYLNSSFDREEIANFSLFFRAVDNGNPMFRRSSEAVLSVWISDVNDHLPEFVDAPYAVTVREDAPVGYSIFQVSATDNDLGTNAEVRFRVDPGGGVFDIEPVSGNLTVQGTLRRATTPFYMVSIIAEDNGSPDRLSSITHINITVSEVNDNEPIFESLPQENITIPEDTDPGFVFVNVSVTDEDTGLAGMFDLSLDQTGNVFALDNNSLILNSAVDYEVCDL